MILLDVAILISLMITVIYSWKLNNKISELKKTHKEWKDIITNFDNAIEKGEITVKELKELGNKIFNMIQAKLDEGRLLVDDLSFMTDRATNLADKLENNISSARKIESATPIINRPIIESSIEKQYSKKSDNKHELKKSTIESLLARIAKVKENNNKNDSMSFDQQTFFKKNNYYEDA